MVCGWVVGNRDGSGGCRGRSCGIFSSGSSGGGGGKVAAAGDGSL